MEAHYHDFAMCKLMFYRRQTQSFFFSADDIIIENIRNNTQSGVEFEMYAQTSDSTVLNQQALSQAVMVRNKWIQYY